MKPVHVVSNQKGFVDLIVMLGLMTFATLALVSVAYQKRQLQLNTDSKLAVDILQQSYSYYIQDSDAWKKTLYDPRNATTFACLKDGSECSQTLQPIAVIVNANNEIVVDTDSDKGVQMDGTICSGFSSGTPTCPLHVSLNWQPVCKTTCTNPRTIQIEVSFNRGSSFAGGFAARFIASSVANVVRKPLETPIVTAVGVGKQFTCALAEGQVYCWGSNSNGVLGPAATGDSSVPVRITGLPSGVGKIEVGMETVCAIVSGNVYCWGQYHGGATPQLIYNLGGTALSNVTDVSIGIGHSCAITAAGEAYCWGGNTYATLGYAVPPTLDFPMDYNTWSGPNGPAFPVIGLSRGINGPDLGPVTSIAAGNRSTCAVVSGGVRCWGMSESRGGNPDMSLPFYPVHAYDPMGPKGHKICYPWVHAGTVLPAPPGDGTMYGYFLSPSGGGALNDIGMCNPTPEPTDYPILDSNVKQIAVSFGSFCALFNNGDLACWGHYDNGKLARSLPAATQEPQMVTTIHGVESLGHHSTGFFALKGGRLWAWGKNNIGNSMGDPSGAWTPPFWGSIWDPVELTGLPANISQFQGGASDEGYHNCAVSDQKVYCWGMNDVGQLGDGTTVNQLMGTPTLVNTWP